jgi:hypothetical protein
MPETTLLNSVHPIEIKRDTGVVYDAAPHVTRVVHTSGEMATTLARGRLTPGVAPFYAEDTRSIRVTMRTILIQMKTILIQARSDRTIRLIMSSDQNNPEISHTRTVTVP